MNLANRILIVGPSWVGDMVMAQSLFKILNLELPDCEIDVLAPSWSLPIIERMPEVSNAIKLPFKHGQLNLRKRWLFGHSFRNNYQRAILLTNSWKSAIIPFSANISKRTGWIGELRFGLVNDIRINKKKYEKTVERFVALAFSVNKKNISIPFPSLTIDTKKQKIFLSDFGIGKEADRPLLGLCPGSEVQKKCWSKNGFAEIAETYLNRDWDVFLFGSEKDRDYCEKINVKTKNRCINLAGQTSLTQVIDLMSACDAVVSNDSGLMHVAAAVDRPLVGIFLCTDPKFTPPLCSKKEIISRYDMNEKFISPNEVDYSIQRVLNME